MKSISLVLLCLAVASQGRVLQLPKEALDIPVTIIEDKEPPLALALVQEETKPIVPEPVKPIIQEQEAIPIIDAPKPIIEEALKTIIEEALKEDSKPIVEEPKVQEKLEAIKPNEEIRALNKDEEIKGENKEEVIKAEEIKPEIKEEEIKPLIKAEEPKPELKVEEIKSEFKEEQIKPAITEEQITAIKEEPKPEEVPAQIILKSLPAEDTVVVPAEEVDASPVVEDLAELGDHAQPHLRQATQATPTQQQSTTQGNFVQQLIQNSPIGQFLNQFQPQQPAQQAAVQPLAADEAAQPTPAPTIPGFLNPAQAITSAQQAVQNAAQSVVNSTTQAFQGIQQFASNLGNQFQSTLTGLTNPGPTTPRPPGPIQQFVSNIFGGGNNATAAAAAAAPAPPQQNQNQNPLQGIINFLGGNRPQNAPAVVAPAPVTEAPAKPEVDDKIDPANDEVAEFSEDQNEVRASGESVDDSFEEAIPTNEVIVVNDDASDGREVLLDTIVQPLPIAAVDAAAL
ncbi:20-hydroxyecdysone protein isoform X1 [Drosophila guanche]|uniref:Blast:20-hydroxyecdysone protein n=1 Tax=Drosophila guanche TaxID=7266 RepID=A0A3B0JYT8_DROGU|nr:20-hydroxyecdysone protein isoform X1 [Drosophila guanche]SPP87237.1 blast:20-hydroxyecdysone protein [Drosophila guanche]